MKKIRVTVFNEFRHEKSDEVVKKIYPQGIHGKIKEFLSECDDLEIRLAALDDEDFGLGGDVLDNTDVLIWWAHTTHELIPDELAFKIRKRVYEDGMGLIALHSSHYSKPFRYTVGATGHLNWGDNQEEIMWNIMPSHPIAEGIPKYIHFDEEELYAEPFQVPNPDATVFISSFKGGGVFRSGLCYLRGAGRVFYFQPGHETVPTYYNTDVQKIIKNAVHWAKPANFGYEIRKDSPCIGEGNYYNK